MKRMLIGCCVLLAAGPAAAQKPAADRPAMYEDVEVMRRLLADAVGRGRADAAWVTERSGNFPYYLDPLSVTGRITWTNGLNTARLPQQYGVVGLDRLQPYLVAADSPNVAATVDRVDAAVDDRPESPRAPGCRRIGGRATRRATAATAPRTTCWPRGRPAAQR